MTKLDKPIILTIEHQEVVDLLAALLGELGVRNMLAFKVDTLEVLKMFAVLSENASKIDKF